jgi:transcriptional regulator with XRE-family HTH domain
MKDIRNLVLTNARKSLNLSQTEFAERIGTVKSVYNAIERLKYFPSKKYREKISNFLMDKGIYLFEEDLFPKGLYTGKPDVESLSLDEIEENKIPCEENQVLEEMDSEHLKNGIGRVLNSLPYKEKVVLTSFFGLNDKEEAKSLENISKSLDKKVTDKRVGQIKQKALNRCRCRVGLPGWSIFPMKDYLIN